jgi:hypothetical protein
VLSVLGETEENIIKDYTLSQVYYRKLQNTWVTLKIYTVPDSPKDYVCTKFGQNPLKDVDSRVFTRMLCGKNLTRWHWPLTYNLENQPNLVHI